jgi:hypothetical protein
MCLSFLKLNLARDYIFMSKSNGRVLANSLQATWLRMSSIELSIQHIVQANHRAYPIRTSGYLYIRPNMQCERLNLNLDCIASGKFIACSRINTTPDSPTATINPPPFLLDIFFLYIKHLLTGFLASHF